MTLKFNILKTISVLAALAIIFGVLVFSVSQKASERDTNTALSKQQDYPLTVDGVVITQQPERVVVLSAFIYDILNNLDYNNVIVGISNECLADSVSDIQLVGDKKNPDIEKIKFLEPDLIFIDYPLSSDQLDSLESYEIKVVTLSKAQDFNQFGKLYTDIGSIMGGSIKGYEQAATCANGIYISIQDISNLVPDRRNQNTICYMYDTMGTVIPGNTLANDIMEFSGATNIARDKVNSFMDIEQIIESNPNYIFCESGLLDEIKNSAKLSEIRAVKEDNVYEMDSEFIEAQDNKVIDALIFMVSTMYPELVS